jgi:hypothetical protein
MKHFFISYNRADRSWAEWIAWQLEAAGHSVVIQAWDFREGGNFVLDMQRAVEEAQRTIVVLSPDFLASKFTAPEWAAAFAQDPTGVQGRLLPVRVRECQPSGLLGQIVYIDLVGAKTRDAARERLLAGVAAARRKPLAEPELPPLDPGQARTAAAPEPPWPPSLELASRVVGSLFWRAVRIVALVIGVALAVLAFLSRAMPAWVEASPGALYSAALVWGVMVALATEAGLRLWRRRRGGPTAGGRGGA